MTAKIKLNAASGGGSFSLQAPSSSANNRVMTLPDSADGTVLTTTNPKSKSVIQVVSTNNTSQVSTTATSLASPTDSGMSVTITPSSASNEIIIMICASLRGDGNNANVNALIKRNGTLIDYSACSSDGILDYGINFTATNSSWNFIDTAHGSTSALTYGFFFTRYGGSGTAYFNNNSSHFSLSTMTAMEVAA